MSPWKQLPHSLDPRARHLVVQLRRLKDHSGLSLQALASRTGYSRSSWDRYLNGRALPPQRAVAAFARACAADAERLLALHELAAAATDGPGGPGGGARREGPDQPRNPESAESAESAEPTEQAEPAEPTEQAGQAGAASTSGKPEEEPENGGGGRSGLRPWVTASVAAAVTAVVVLTVLLVTAPGNKGEERGGRVVAAGSPVTDPEQKPFVFRPGKDYPCAVHRDDDGLLYAGYSRTRTALIGKGSTQWAVVEAQCLLRHHGFPPGLADGIFGSRTERAVKRLQRDAHIVVDGVVGEDTWGVLRK
ncbi:helix-turn-helix domain-containing protein [Streptomyces thermoalcalitolerans]